MEVSTRSISQSLNLYAVFGYLLPGFFLATLYIVDFDVSLILRLYSHGKILNFKDLESIENLRLNLLMS